MEGGTGNDNIGAAVGNDALRGDAGNDTLDGASGDDLIVGGPGTDSQSGGSGRDIYRFETAADSGPTGSDIITQFDAAGAAAGDRIDLSAIDANAGVAGNQAFALGGTTAGRLKLATEGTNTVVLANTDADTAVELRIVLRDGSRAASAYTAEDFIL